MNFSLFIFSPFYIITPAIKCCQEDTPDKRLDCAEEEGGDAGASATDDDKAADPLDKQILAIFGCRSNNSNVLSLAALPFISAAIYQVSGIGSCRNTGIRSFSIRTLSQSSMGLSVMSKLFSDGKFSSGATDTMLL